MTTINNKLQRISSALTRDASGNITPTKRFSGGAHSATRRISPSLIEPCSYYRKILRVLAQATQPVTTKNLTAVYNSTYGEKKTAQSINARLSELYTYALITHVDKNNSGGRWLVRAGLDVNNDSQIACAALASIEKLRQKPK
jgi:hypothetical protein